MNNLLRLAAVMLSLGMLGASACSSCSQTADTSSGAAVSPPQSYTCGVNTHLEGSQCVGNSASTSTSTSTAKKN